MMLISFDQGPMGHQRRKPTSIGTNLVAKQLEEVRGPGRSYGLGTTLEQRLKDSKKWAEWAPGLKKALLAAVEMFLKSRRAARLTMQGPVGSSFED